MTAPRTAHARLRGAFGGDLANRRDDGGPRAARKSGGRLRGVGATRDVRRRHAYRAHDRGRASGGCLRIERNVRIGDIAGR